MIAPIPITSVSLEMQVSMGITEGFSYSVSLIAAENLKVLPKNKVKKIDAHKLKEEFVGKADVSKFDIYWDTDETDIDKRKIILVKKSDTSITIDTGLTWEEVWEDYPKDDKNLYVELETTIEL